MFIDETILPKIWLGRVDKYWDKKVPTDFPKSSSEFSLKFDAVEKPAVDEFLETFGTEESPIFSILPENSYISEFIGIYNVDGKSGVETLLSPEKFEVGVKDTVAAVHFNKETGTWEAIENVVVRDSYVYGVLESFSPIAVYATRPEIEVVTDFDWKSKKVAVVANGNAIKIVKGEDGNIHAVNINTGNDVIVKATGFAVVGGTIDGTDVDSTSVYVNGIDDDKLDVYAGSVKKAEDEEACRIGEANALVENSTVRCVSGSGGSVKTNVLNITVKNSVVKSHVGAGQSTCLVVSGKDANTFPPSLASKFYVKTSNINVENSDVYIMYFAPHSGYSYTQEAFGSIKGGTIGYLTAAASNGIVDHAKVKISGIKSTINVQGINRGSVGNVEMFIEDSEIPNLYLFGDSTDSEVTGVLTGKAKLDIGKGGKYGFHIGNNNGEPVTSVDNIDNVKVSRSAEFEISDAEKALLGINKFIIK